MQCHSHVISTYCLLKAKNSKITKVSFKLNLKFPLAFWILNSWY